MKINKIDPVYFCIVALVIVFVMAFFERFGTYPHFGSTQYRNGELILGLVFPLLLLIIPIFEKKNRDIIWTKTNIIMLIIVIVINVIILTVLYANKSYYSLAWLKDNWDRSNCPPIRWDVWNIIGKSA